MQTVRDAMSTDIRYVAPEATVLEAARQMAQSDIGALPVCQDDRRLEGVITDRDIAVGVVAAGLDPVHTRVGDVITRGEVVTVGADEAIDTAVSMMKRHAVRRIPVLDGSRVVGILTQADVAERVDTEEVGDMVRTISRAPGNTGDGP
jgi:CBS domain-containing protein